MDEKITMVGVAVLAAGLLLLFGFMPLIGESADKISDDYDTNTSDFRNYEPGDKVTVYGKVTGIQYTHYGTRNFTAIELDNEDSLIYVEGNVTGSVEKGDRIYVKCFIDDNSHVNNGSEYLRANPDDIHNRTTLDIIFSIVVVSGIVIIIAGVKRL